MPIQSNSKKTTKPFGLRITFFVGVLLFGCQSSETNNAYNKDLKELDTKNDSISKANNANNNDSITVKKDAKANTKKIPTAQDRAKVIVITETVYLTPKLFAHFNSIPPKRGQFSVVLMLGVVCAHQLPSIQTTQIVPAFAG